MEFVTRSFWATSWLFDKHRENCTELKKNDSDEKQTYEETEQGEVNKKKNLIQQLPNWSAKKKQSFQVGEFSYS